MQVHFTENEGRKIDLYSGWFPLNAGCPLNKGSAYTSLTVIIHACRGTSLITGGEERKGCTLPSS